MKTTLDKLFQWPAKLDSMGNSIQPVLVLCLTASECLYCTLYLLIFKCTFLIFTEKQHYTASPRKELRTGTE